MIIDFCDSDSDSEIFRKLLFFVLVKESKSNQETRSYC